MRDSDEPNATATQADHVNANPNATTGLLFHNATVSTATSASITQPRQAGGRTLAS